MAQLGSRLPDHPLMRPYALLFIYRNRVRAQASQELLAGAGIAIAVALIFATLVASGSIAGAASEVVHKVVGPSKLQLRALGPEGLEEHLLARVERLPGVKQAAPILEVPASVSTTGGRRLSVAVIGADISLGTLDGLAHTLPGAVLSERAIALTRTSARALRISPSEVGAGAPLRVSLAIRGRAVPLSVSAVIGPEAAGPLAQVQGAVMPIESLQGISGLEGRISRIFVRPYPRDVGMVRSELARLAQGHMSVVPADQDVALLHQALRPSNQATALFAVIAVLLGFLFAFNAMLLTIPERRMTIADLRIDGTRRSAIIEMVLFEALLLGLLASVVGLAGGYALAVGVFHQSAGYLAQAFVLGTSTVIGPLPVVLALFGGLLAPCAASVVLLTDLRGGRAVDAVYFENGTPGNALGPRMQRRLFAASLALLSLAALLLALVPSLTLIACAMLALVTVLAVPLVLSGALGLGEAISLRYERFTTLPVAITSLRSTTIRSLALAATGAVALFGSVALGGARGDLLHGLAAGGRANAADGNIWIINPGDIMQTSTFIPSADLRRIASLPQVAGVSAMNSQFADVNGHLVLALARPSGTGRQILHTQIVAGNLDRAIREFDSGGWIAASRQLADESHTRVGGLLRVNTPTGPRSFRLAAETSNFGWPEGSLLLNSRDYMSSWATGTPTALAVRLKPGVSIRQGQRAIHALLGDQSGLEVLSAGAWTSRFEALAGEGLGQLGQISTMLVIAAILALAAALSSILWQQRPALSALRLEGSRPHRLARLLLVEASFVLGVGCACGIVAGLAGQLAIDAYLAHVTGFPVQRLATSLRPIEVGVVVALAVLAIVALPGWLASRISPALALEQE